MDNSGFNLEKITKLLGKLSKVFFRFSVPILLGILIVLPAIIGYLRGALNQEEIEKPIQVEFGNIKSTVRSTATIEYEYKYEVKAYQNTIIDELFVEEGDLIEEDQLIARLDPVGSSTLRLTDIDGQIASTIQELNNLEASKNDTLALNNVTGNQLNVQVENIDAQISRLEQDIFQEVLDNATEIGDLQDELDALQAEYDELKANTNINDTISQYEAEIDAKEAQLSSLEATETSLSSSYSAQVTVVNGLEASCIDPMDPCQDELTAAILLQNQLLDQLDDVSDQRRTLEDEIEDLEDEIEELKESDDYDPYDNDPPISNEIQSGNNQGDLAELLAEINQKEAEIEALEDSPVIDNLEDQLETLEDQRKELIASQDVTQTNLGQSVSSIDQRIAATNVQLNNLYQKRQDLSEDISEQTETKVFSARRSGVIANIAYEEGEEVPLNGTALEIVSEKKVIVFRISADNRELIEEGMSISFPNDFSEEDDLKISSISISPIEKEVTGLGGNNGTLEYEVEIEIPDSSDSKWVVGKEVDLDVIIAEKDDVFNVPRTAIFEGRIFVARGLSNQDDLLFDEIIDLEVETGLETGRVIEIKNGIGSEDYVFPFYPRTEELKDQIRDRYSR